MKESEMFQQLRYKYGDKQLIVAIEELSELQKELCKALRGEVNIENLIEEIADAKIMINQVIDYYAIPSVVVRRKINIKLKRTEERELKSES